MRREERGEVKPKTETKSKIQDRESAILCPVYFPFTFVSPSLVEAMSLFFRQVVVYQPAFSKPQEALRPWTDRGFVDIRTPFEKVIDKKLLEAALQSFRNWGLLHEHADMTYLKMVGNDIAPVGPEIARIVSDIKGVGEKRSKSAEESELFRQVFIHMAHEFDEHSWELRQRINRFNDQYRALQSFFRQDQAEHAHEPISQDLSACASPALSTRPLVPSSGRRVGGRASDWQAGLFPVMREDPGILMIEKRMSAWNHLFQKEPAGSSILFTNSPSALAYLLDGAQGKIEALKFNVTYRQAELSNVLKDHLSWAGHLQEIFNTVLTTPWSRTLQERVIGAAREIEARIDHLRGSTVRPPDRSVSFHWHVVPFQVARNLLNRCCGIDSSHEEDEAAKDKNTLVGLIEEG